MGIMIIIFLSIISILLIIIGILGYFGHRVEEEERRLKRQQTYRRIQHKICIKCGKAETKDNRIQHNYHCKRCEDDFIDSLLEKDEEDEE